MSDHIYKIIQLVGSSPTSTEDSFLGEDGNDFLSGRSGNDVLKSGDFDGAADTLAIYAPLVDIEQIDGDFLIA